MRPSAATASSTPASWTESCSIPRSSASWPGGAQATRSSIWARYGRRDGPFAQTSSEAPAARPRALGGDAVRLQLELVLERLERGDVAELVCGRLGQHPVG